MLGRVVVFCLLSLSCLNFVRAQSTPQEKADDTAPAVRPGAADSDSSSNASSAVIGSSTHGGFLRRLFEAYREDWHPSTQSNEEPKYRGYPAPVTNPPFPFAVWPIGGTVWIGYPNATSYPLTTAIYGSEHGQWLKKANIQIYGWLDVGFNVSTSNDGPYANAPAAYPQVANSV